jgi:diaminohydroxyphosphoribosylaminopyrimidine deaminase / 5-amino-6-(5-phosphoribosylamino)uracil reductase
MLTERGSGPAAARSEQDHVWNQLLTYGVGSGSDHAMLKHSLTKLHEPLLTADPARPFVVAQLGQSLDGRIATETGESRYISGLEALDHLHRVRALVDAVVVGVGTVVADDPQLTVRRVAGRSPARVIIDRRGRSCRDAKWLVSDGVERIVFTADRAGWPDGVRIVRLASAETPPGPAEIVAALFALGYRKLLIEGGADTVSRFIDAGAVDRLHVGIAPVIIGSGRCGLSMRPIASLNQALRPRVHVHMFDDGDVLFDCDLRSDARREDADDNV